MSTDISIRLKIHNKYQELSLQKLYEQWYDTKKIIIDDFIISDNQLKRVLKLFQEHHVSAAQTHSHEILNQPIILSLNKTEVLNQHVILPQEVPLSGLSPPEDVPLSELSPPEDVPLSELSPPVNIKEVPNDVLLPVDISIQILSKDIYRGDDFDQVRAPDEKYNYHINSKTYIKSLLNMLDKLEAAGHLNFSL
jgi:hypothetical protein